MSAASTPIYPKAWQQSALIQAKSIRSLLITARDLAIASGDDVGRVLGIAEGAITAWIHVAGDEAPTAEAAGAWLNQFFDIKALADGALSLATDAWSMADHRPEDEPRAAVLTAACHQCDVLVMHLDTPVLPAIGRADYMHHSALRGQVMFTGMMEAIRANPEAGVADQVLEHLRFDFGAQEGFSAALTDCLTTSTYGSSLPSLRDVEGTTVQAGEHGGSKPATVDQSLTGWRAEVAALVERAEGAMGEAAQIELGDGNGPFACRLVYEAQKVLDAGIELLHTGSADDYYGGVVILATAMVTGARDMANTHPDLQAMLQGAVEAFHAAAEVLDTAELQAQPQTVAPVSREERIAAGEEGGDRPTAVERADPSRPADMELQA